MRTWIIFFLAFSTSSFGEDAFLSSLAKSHDFSETQINGEKKEPFGDLLQGSKKQKLDELIQLEPEIAQEILKTKTALKLSPTPK